MQKNINTWLGVGLILIIAIALAGTVVFVEQKKSLISVDLPEKGVIVDNTNEDNLVNGMIFSQKATNENENQKQFDCDGKILKKGCVIWKQPEDIGDIVLTDKTLYQGCGYGEQKCQSDEMLGSSGIKYVRVGKISAGDYKNYEVLVVMSGVYEGPSSAPDVLHALRSGDEVIFLAKDFDEYQDGFFKRIFSKGVAKKIFNKEIVLEELDFPAEIFTEKGKFEKDKYARVFFTDAKLKKAFMHEKIGQFWVTDEVKAVNENPNQFELNAYKNYKGETSYYDIFGRHEFYANSSDGLAVAYKFVPGIFSYSGDDRRVAKLEAIWNSGGENDSRYELNPSGCGGGASVYNETLKLNPEVDLEIVGKTKT